jgi:hypothetical protein
MGCSYELNDTLLLSADQGFPEEYFNYKEHLKDPSKAKSMEGRVFQFFNKRTARAFQLDPVRVFFFQNTDEGKWLAWGKVLIQSLHIEHVGHTVDKDNLIKFQPTDWMTSGSYKILEVYDPEYQKAFTQHEAPSQWNFFADD